MSKTLPDGRRDAVQAPSQSGAPPYVPEPPTRPTGRKQATHELLQNRDFRLLWIGQLLSQIGDNCLLVAAITLISNLSDSTLIILVPALSLVLPQVVFGLVGGVMADRWNRKLVMVGSSVLRGIIVLSILLVNDVQDLWILCLAAAALSMVGVFFYPARNAVIPSIVPPGLLLTANSLVQGSYIIALIVGPVIAGAAVELWMPAAIIFDSAALFTAAVFIALMHVPRVRRARVVRVKGSVWEDLKAGLQFMRRSRVLRQVLVITAIATLGIGAIVLLAIPHLKQQVGATGLEYGLAMSTLGLGSVMGGLIVSRVSRRLSTSATVGGLLILAGLDIVVFAVAPSYMVVLVSLAGIGLCVVTVRGALDTVTQALAPDEVRGRVQSAVNLIVASSTAAAEGFAALLGSLVGVQTVFLAAGVLTISTGLVALFVLRDVAQLAGQGLVTGEA